MQAPLSIPSQECALLVLSCDAYADLWPPFFNLLRRHWPDCPFPIFLGAGEAAIAPPGITCLQSNGGKDWSRCASDYLEALPHEHILVMLDDFFLRRRVQTIRILECLRFAKTHDATQLRLIPRPKPTNRLPEQTNIGSCAVGSPYRLSTQAAIWNRRKLHALLREHESIWEFEMNGNLRANASPDGFFSVRRGVLPYEGLFAHHVIEKGKWLPHERWIFQRQLIGCDFSRRSALPLGQTMIYQAAQTLNESLNWLPWRWKAGLLRKARRVLQPVLGRQFSQLRGDKLRLNTPQTRDQGKI
ncbi:MAG: hypothetical protein ABIO94_02155 [Opitutaceae bacterium]